MVSTDDESQPTPADDDRESLREALELVASQRQADVDRFREMIPSIVDEVFRSNRRRRSTHRGSNSEQVVELLASSPDRVWTAQEIADALGVSVGSARTTLNRLDGFRVSKPSRGRFRYLSTQPELGGIDD